MQCEKSYTLEYADRKHLCVQTVPCDLCKDRVNPDFHDCFLKPLSLKEVEKLEKKSSSWKMLFFDVETIQNRLEGPQIESINTSGYPRFGTVFSQKHLVNALAVEKVCYQCKGITRLSPSPLCSFYTSLRVTESMPIIPYITH
ncbi:hypothetical protein L596_025589 [Steinernema carpocapsae]|uniref:Uncharacterized protein n=1 Tax=Steinernema carpocapsae TaxID=34508 RepID=A0A4U5M865_STECR|nr:hypothetical protein L596_025589 [Steinernema carpocapsae]